MRREAVRWTTAAAAVGLLLGGCTTSSSDPERAPQLTSAPDVEATPTDLTSYTSQPVAWQSCPASDDYLDSIPAEAQCATIEVPVNYFDDSSDRGDMSIALIKIPAKGQSRGHLLINPGGPGGSGFDFAADSADELRRNLPGYDIVGFDPRGVQRSEGFDCGTSKPQRLDYIEHDFSPESAAELDSLVRVSGDYEGACLDNYPNWGFLGTSSVARDMHVIHQALGDPKLNYFGVSYGTEIGYEYLRAFPDDVGRMILESPVDPAVEDVLADQLAAFNDQLESRLRACAEDRACGQGRSFEQVREEFTEVLRNVEDPSNSTLTSGTRPSERLVYYGMVLPLYWEDDPQYTKWYVEAIDMLLNDGDASAFEFWGYLYEGYDPDTGEFFVGDDILPVVSCLDVGERPEDLELAQELRDDKDERGQIRQQAPLFNALAFEEFYQDQRLFGGCGYSNEAWADPTIPNPAAEAVPVTNPGGNPVLLIGITGDTATPYEWAQTISGNLGVPLITHDTTGHAVYADSDNPCLQAIVATYLGTGDLPAEPITCPAA